MRRAKPTLKCCSRPHRMTNSNFSMGIANGFTSLFPEIRVDTYSESAVELSDFLVGKLQVRSGLRSDRKIHSVSDRAGRDWNVSGKLAWLGREERKDLHGFVDHHKFEGCGRGSAPELCLFAFSARREEARMLHRLRKASSSSTIRPTGESSARL